MFAGYRIKKTGFFLVWFLIGFRLVTWLMPWLSQMVPAISGSEFWGILLPLAGGLLLGLLGFSIEKICLGGICFALVMMITAQSFGTEPQTLVIGAVVGVIAAGAGVMLIKPATIIATALAGAYIFTLSTLEMFTGISAQTFYYPILLGATAVGAVTQFLTTKHID